MATVKSEKPHAQAKLLSPTEKCKICHEQAAKHIHYGAMTCFSCRAFFRRSIQNKTAAAYACRRNKMCEINLKTRKNCQFCRYQKCLKVGMKPTWVLSEEERERRFRKVRERQNSDRNSFSEDSLLDPRGMDDTGTEAVLLSKDMMLDEENMKLFHATTPSDRSSECNALSPETPESTNSAAIETKYFINESSSENYAIGPPPLTSEHSNLKVKEKSGGLNVSAVGSASGLQLSTRLNQQNETKAMTNPVAVPVNVIVQHHPAQHINNAYPMHPLDRLDKQAAAAKPVLEQYGTNIVEDHDMREMADMMGSPCFQEISITVSSPSSVYSKSNTHGGGDESEEYAFHSPFNQNVMADDFLETCLENDDSYSSSDDEISLKLRMFNEPIVKLTIQEESYLQKLIESHNERYRSVSFGEEMIKELIMCSMFSIPVSTTAAINGYRLCVERVSRIAHNLEGYKVLPDEDKRALLMENADLLVSLRGAIFFDPRKKGKEQVLISMGDDDMNIIDTMFSQLMKEDNMKHIDYKTFNSIQAVGSNPKEDRYNLIQEKVGSKLVDEAVVILLTCVILFSGDFCSLSRPSIVQKAQCEFTSLLQRYIYSKYPKHEACLEYAAIFEVFTLIREMAEIKKSRSINTTFIKL